jgi:hypothetical protein
MRGSTQHSTSSSGTRYSDDVQASHVPATSFKTHQKNLFQHVRRIKTNRILKQGLEYKQMERKYFDPLKGKKDQTHREVLGTSN